MKFNQNKKKIDPRYFIEETADRDRLQEQESVPAPPREPAQKLKPGETAPINIPAPKKRAVDEEKLDEISPVPVPTTKRDDDEEKEEDEKLAERVAKQTISRDAIEKIVQEVLAKFVQR